MRSEAVLLLKEGKKVQQGDAKRRGWRTWAGQGSGKLYGQPGHQRTGRVKTTAFEAKMNCLNLM